MEEYKNGYKAFMGNKTIEDYFTRKIEEALYEINNKSTQIEKDPDRLIKELKKKFSVKKLNIDENKITTTCETQLVDSDFFPESFNVKKGSKYPKPVFRTYIPISGPKELIHYRTSIRVFSYKPLINDYDQGIYFEQIAFSDKEEEINDKKKNKKKNIECIKRHIVYINEDIQSGNQRISQKISKKVQEILEAKSIGNKILDELQNKE